MDHVGHWTVSIYVDEHEQQARAAYWSGRAHAEP